MTDETTERDTTTETTTPEVEPYTTTTTTTTGETTERDATTGTPDETEVEGYMITTTTTDDGDRLDDRGRAPALARAARRRASAGATRLLSTFIDFTASQRKPRPSVPCEVASEGISPIWRMTAPVSQ